MDLVMTFARYLRSRCRLKPFDDAYGSTEGGFQAIIATALKHAPDLGLKSDEAVGSGPNMLQM